MLSLSLSEQLTRILQCLFIIVSLDIIIVTFPNISHFCLTNNYVTIIFDFTLVYTDTDTDLYLDQGLAIIYKVPPKNSTEYSISLLK